MTLGPEDVLVMYTSLVSTGRAPTPRPSGGR